MLRDKQFSLRYLFLEVLWISLAIGATRPIVLAWIHEGNPLYASFWVPAAVGLWTIAICGMFLQQTDAIAAGIALFLIGLLLTPAVMA
jgi:hypothetical protein